MAATAAAEVVATVLQLAQHVHHIYMMHCSRLTRATSWMMVSMTLQRRPLLLLSLPLWLGPYRARRLRTAACVVAHLALSQRQQLDPHAPRSLHRRLLLVLVLVLLLLLLRPRRLVVLVLHLSCVLVQLAL